MDPRDAISKILSSVEGAVDAVVMDDRITDAIRGEEDSVRSSTGVDVINEAFNQAVGRDVRICIFCDRDIADHDGSAMTLEDLDGNVLGRTLSHEEVQEYRSRPDVIFVSDDFVMFTDVIPSGGERFVMKPMGFPVLGEADGCRDVVMCSPAPSSDAMLKRYYGRDPAEDIATLIVGYDHLKSISP